MDHIETMHTCCGYIEDVHVNFCRGKILFDKITALMKVNFQVRLQIWTWTFFRLGFNMGQQVCNRLLPEFSSNQFETFSQML